MPILERPDGEIYYEEFGSGFPILLFAPGGLRSALTFWRSPAEGPARPWSDWTEALASKFRVIAMDQRNAGRSKAAIRADHGWHTYAADHFALMDHLGHGRFHVLGGCIGGSFCLKAIEAGKGRIASAVLQNPIGFNPEHPTYFQDGAVTWGAEQHAARPEITEADLAGFSGNMWAGDFVFCVDRDFVRQCPAPTMLLPGGDIPHPAVTSAELAALLPGVDVLDPWKNEFAAQRTRVTAFLDAHTPR